MCTACLGSGMRGMHRPATHSSNDEIKDAHNICNSANVQQDATLYIHGFSKCIQRKAALLLSTLLFLGRIWVLQLLYVGTPTAAMHHMRSTAMCWIYLLEADALALRKWTLGLLQTSLIAHSAYLLQYLATLGRMKQPTRTMHPATKMTNNNLHIEPTALPMACNHLTTNKGMWQNPTLPYVQPVLVHQPPGGDPCSGSITIPSGSAKQYSWCACGAMHQGGH
jgi:hypothetical protein